MTPYDDGLKKCPHCGFVPGTDVMQTRNLSPGVVLHGRYIVGRVLGVGGFGITYIGYDMTLDKRIAIKEYFPGEFATRMPRHTSLTFFSDDVTEPFSKGKDKFLEEARTLMKFDAVPEIVDVFDCFEENETAYIVMEYVEGESLKQYLEKVGKMTVEESLPIILDVLHALEAAHSVNMLHRDVAPDNIYLIPVPDHPKQFKVKLLDFGAARFMTTTKTRSLTTLYKDGYAPEEQYRSRGNQGTWTDVYAVGATFYKMLTGITPDTGPDRYQNDTLKPPSKCGVAIGPNTENAILNALNVRTEDRTQTAKAFEDELMANVVVRVVEKKPDVPEYHWPKWMKAAVAVGAAAVLGFAILLATGVIRFQSAGSGASDLDETQTRVPNIINQEETEAQQIAEEALLQLQIYDKQYSNEIPANRVLNQDPGVGIVVSRNTFLRVVMSAGIERTRVPMVIGMESEKAEQTVKDAGLVPVLEEKEYRMAPGTVATQSLEAGTQTDTGTEIKLLISLGLPGGDSSIMEIVDDLTGMQFDDASDAMIEKFLYIINAESRYSEEFEAGQIMSQDIEPGKEVPQNSNINVVVSLGPELVTVPDVQYKTREEAETLLAEAGLTATFVEEYSSNVQEGNVTRQDVEAGTGLRKGSEITVFVSIGAEPVRVRETQAERPVTQNNDAARQQAEAEAARQREAEAAAAAAAAEAARQREAEAAAAAAAAAQREAEQAASQQQQSSGGGFWDQAGQIIGN